MRINNMLRWCIYTPLQFFPPLTLLSSHKSMISVFSTLISANALDKSRWKLLQKNKKNEISRRTTTTPGANSIFQANWVTAPQNKHAVGFQQDTRSGRQLISVFGSVLNEPHSGGDRVDCRDVDGWRACQGPVHGWFMLIGAGGSCGCFLWSVK